MAGFDLRTRLAARLLGVQLSQRGMSVKQNPVAPAILSLGPYQAKWMQSDYDTYSREGYIGNPYVFAAIRQISTALAGIPWMVYDSQAKKTMFDEHPYLALLRRPNPTMGGARFWEATTGYLMIDGNSYVTSVGPNNGPPDELWPLRPDRMRVVPGTTQQMVSGYVYAVGNLEVPLPEPKVHHWKFWHPTNDWYGLSPIQAASKSVDQSNMAKAWNVALLQNGGQPSGMIAVPEVLDPMAYQRLKEEIEQRYAGFMNAGRPFIAEGGSKWQEMGLSPKDMSWLESQNLSAREIAMIFNIAPELIGDPASKTFSNYQEARKALYEETVLPLMDWFRDDLNAWLSPLYDGAYADYDRNNIEALQESRNETYTRINTAFAAGWMTMGVAQAEAGHEVDKAVEKYYRWQLPQFAQADPTAPPPEPIAPPIALPHPELPAEHPLNQKPPQLPGAEAGEGEPATPPSKGEAAGANAGEGAGSSNSGGEGKAVAAILAMLAHSGARIVIDEPAVKVQEVKRADRTDAILPFLVAASKAEEARRAHS